MSNSKTTSTPSKPVANPNWPAKTGKPSGGNRGNNPPGTKK